MTSEAAARNVELVRALIETLNSGGSAAVLARAEEFGDPDIVWKGIAAGRGAPGGNILFRGYEGLRRFYAEYEEVVEDIQFKGVRYEPIGDRGVLLLARIEGRGRGSGIPFEAEAGIVYRLRAGRIILGESFPSHAEAEAEARRLAEEPAGA